MPDGGFGWDGFEFFSEDSLEIGDLVQHDGQRAVVMEISMDVVTVRTADGQTHYKSRKVDRVGNSGLPESDDGSTRGHRQPAH